MTIRKHLGRGLDSVSHLFLSRRSTSSADPAPATSPAPDPMARDVDFTDTPTPYLFVASGADVISKSVVACNVALELARRGHRTAVVDADPSQPTLRLLMGARLDSSATPPSLSVNATHGVALFDSLAEIEATPGAWHYVVVNTPLDWLEQMPAPSPVRRLLLVVSPETPDLIRSYALIKRMREWHSSLQLGIVISGLADEPVARAFFNQFLDVLGRRLHVLPAFFGVLPERRLLGRSVLQRVPAVLEPDESDLAVRLRAITSAVMCEFEPGGSVGNE